MRRVIFEAAESRRVVRGSDDDAIRETLVAAPVAAENRVGDYRSRGVAIACIDHDIDAVARQHLHCTFERRFRERVRIEADIKRSVDILLFAVRQIAWLIARMCASLKELSSEQPRCPEVPNATRCAGTDGSGRAV